MSKRKNLVLGGKGFVGAELVRLLEEKGEEIRIIDRKLGDDLKHAEKYAEMFEWADRTWFIAWEIGIWKHATDPAYQIGTLAASIDLCKSVFGALEKAKKPFLFVSTQFAGYPSVLGSVKRVGEVWTTLLGGLTARFWNVYGFEEIGEKSHVVPDMIYNALTKKRITLLTNGEETRQFLFVRDAAEGLLHQFETGQPVADITNGEWVSIKSVADMIAAKTGTVVETGDGTGHASFAEPKNILSGWSPRFTLDEGLALTIDRIRESMQQKQT